MGGGCCRHGPMGFTRQILSLAVMSVVHVALYRPRKNASSQGATKALLYAAFGASAWRALPALLHHRLAFIGAPGHMLDPRGRIYSRANTLACRGTQWSAHRAPRQLCSSWLACLLL